MPYVPDPNFERALATSTVMRRFLDSAADATADAVRGVAPVRYGDYKASIVHDVVRDRGGFVGRVGSTDFKWHWIEFGTSDTPTFAPLRRGLDATVKRTRRFGR